MNRIFVAAAALAALSACAMPPQGVPETASADFDAAVASVGCELTTERDYLPVELQTGLTREQAVEMAQYKIARGEAAPIEGGGVRLLTGACAPAPQA